MLIGFEKWQRKTGRARKWRKSMKPRLKLATDGYVYQSMKPRLKLATDGYVYLWTWAEPNKYVWCWHTHVMLLRNQGAKCQKTHGSDYGIPERADR
jgi:hypothetical protein